MNLKVTDSPFSPSSVQKFPALEYFIQKFLKDNQLHLKQKIRTQNRGVILQWGDFSAANAYEERIGNQNAPARFYGIEGTIKGEEVCLGACVWYNDFANIPRIAAFGRTERDSKYFLFGLKCKLLYVPDRLSS